MKKALCIAVVALMTVSVGFSQEAQNEPGNIGIGYQGVVLDGWYNTMDQISLRLAPEPVGGALVFGHMKEDDRDGGSDYEYWLAQLKGFVNVIDRKNSDFYIGGSVGWSRYESKWSEDDYALLGVLTGVEWRFNELPEIGFNFEIGYNAAFLDEDGDDSIMKGTYASLGAHYYF